MKKQIIQLLIILSSTLHANAIQAQPKPLACQVDEAAGLLWERGRWVTKNFIRKKFILAQEGKTLTSESVARVIYPSLPFGAGIFCKTYVGGEIMCTDLSGASLFFDPNTFKGGLSRLSGSVSNNDSERDTVTIEVFTCSPF